MNSFKWLALSWLNVIRNTRRSLISTGIIALGSLALLLAAGYVAATFEGLRESTIQGGLGHLQIAPKNAFDDREADLQGLSPEQTADMEAQLNAMPEVRLTTRRVLFEGLVSSGDITIASMGRGVDIANERKISVFSPIVEGRNLSRHDDPFSAVLGERLANNLKINIGDSVTVLATTRYQGINAIDVTVVGFNRSGIPELDERFIMMPLEAAQILTDSEQINRIVVALNQTADTDTVAERAQAFENTSTQTWGELFPFYQSVVTLYKNIFGVMGGIIFVVVFLSVSNTMVMVIMERVNESGTLRAYGFSRARVIGLFTQEGIIMGVAGALLGLIVGSVLILLINSAMIQMPPPPGRSTGYPLVLNWEPLAAIGIFISMSLCGALAAWFPARKMTRLSITNALNHF